MSRAQRRRRGAYRSRAVRVLPLPEAVNGGKPWTIRESASAVPSADPVHRTMTIPTTDSAEDARIRLHEMAHARWTPVNGAKRGQAEGILHTTLNACEDARIHRKLLDAGFDLSGRAHPDELVQNLLDRIGSGQLGKLDAAGLLMASYATGEQAAFQRGLIDQGLSALVAIVRDVYRENFAKRRPAFDRTLDAAKVLEDWFREDPDEEVLSGLDFMLTNDDEYDDDGERETGGAQWGEMRMESPPRPLRLPPRIRARRRRATPEGSIPRQWHRYASDGAVFTQRTKRDPGGAVLIDQSGSMSLTPADVLAILEAAPAAIVATYAGADQYGVLRILAREGKRVADTDVWMELANNTVDGPALEWLGAQDGPRYWVSDGMATAPAGDAIQGAARIALRHRIVRVDDVADLIGRIG